jgi:hypothetical protein
VEGGWCPKKKLKLCLSKYSKNKIPQNNMKKGDKEMKKVLFPILALILALALPMATPVIANPGPLEYDPTRHPGTGEAEVEQGNSINFELSITPDTGTDEVYLPGPYDSIGTYTEIPTAWLSFSPSILTLDDDEKGTTTVTITVPSDATPGIYAKVIKFHPDNPPASAPGPGMQVYINVISSGPPISVEKDYRYTNVCFEKDNDGDGEFNEDPSEQIDNDGDGQFGEDPIDGIDNDGDELTDEDPVEDEIDNDGDELFSEDDVDCPDGTYLGDFLPTDGDYYLLKAVVNKKDVVKSYNPGQYYAVSTVNVLVDVDTLTIEEDFSNCTDIGTLNPVKGGGRLVVVQVGPDDPDEVAYQIYDAKSPEVSFDGDVATVSLEDQKAGTTILVYVKFGPALKGAEWVEGQELTCENTTSAWVEEEDIVSDNAMLELVLKE